MKILQVVNFFSPVHGGSSEVPYQLSKELAKRGHQVTIYTSDYKLSEEWSKSAQELQTNVSSFRTWLNCANLLVTPGIFKRARKETRHFDVVHMHNYRTFQNIVVHYYATKYGIPYVLQAHGSLPKIMAKQRLKQVYDNIWGYRLLKDAARVIAVTEMEAEQYKSMGVSKDGIEIVPNGIDLSKFENLPPGGEFRKKWGIDDSQRIVLYLGRIHKIKGLDLLANAFADLTKELGGVSLVIVGPDDGYLSALKRLVKELEIEEKVLFTGPLYGQEKLEAYIDTDVFVNPGADEIFGLVFLEACACGTPVICSTGCGIADIIDGQVGIAVPYDKEQLRHALLRILENDKLRREFGKKGKLLVRERFNWEKIVERVENIYK